jgi:Flp pilus assembly protein TadB
MGDSQPEETPKERSDRELIELLNEVRVALPGVQVLFAFLLAVPFATGWKRVTTFQKDAFFTAFVATTLSSIFLIAPSAFHRIGWRVANKERIVRAGNTLTLAGLAFLAIAIESVVLLVTDYLFERTTAVVMTAVLGVGFVLVWLVWPLAAREER